MSLKVVLVLVAHYENLKISRNKGGAFKPTCKLVPVVQLQYSSISLVKFYE